MRHTSNSLTVATRSLSFFLLAWSFAETKTITMSGLDLSSMTSGWGKAAPNRSIVGNRLELGGRSFESGIGTHAESEWLIQLDGKAIEFRAVVGVDGEVQASQPGSVEFLVYTDGREAWRSGVLKAAQAPREVRVRLAGVKRLGLTVTDAGDGIDYDHADWADAVIDYSGAAPRAIVAPAPPQEDWVMLTPAAARRPRVHGPKAYGVRPDALNA
jgi:alpha-galactosidase